jgi:uncharacterized protein YjbI with pentapeptide repeats
LRQSFSNARNLYKENIKTYWLMANDEQLNELLQGSVAWNKWRKENPDDRIDLSGANLRGADLRGANLREANLCGADLRGANLREANLCGADLVAADFREANLCGANLCGADLRGIYLWHVE